MKVVLAGAPLDDGSGCAGCLEREGRGMEGIETHPGVMLWQCDAFGWVIEAFGSAEAEGRTASNGKHTMLCLRGRLALGIA